MIIPSLTFNRVFRAFSFPIIFLRIRSPPVSTPCKPIGFVNAYVSHTLGVCLTIRSVVKNFFAKICQFVKRIRQNRKGCFE